MSALKILGIVRDADDDAGRTFQSIQSVLQNAQIPVPKKPMRPEGDDIKVIVMILPNGKDPGEIEDLCLKSVENEPAIQCVDEYFECLKEKEILINKTSKAKVQTYLAPKKAGLKVGHAAEAGIWDFGHESFQIVKDFLMQIDSLN